MRAKCSKCGNVFEMNWTPSLIHMGNKKYMKCPVCGKNGWIDTYVNDPLTWSKEEQEGKKEEEMTKEELQQKRIEESKYERAE